jgi:hypothetical protein
MTQSSYARSPGRFFVAIVSLLTVTLAHADDWPQWRGLKRDGHSSEKSLLTEWPKDGPNLVWQAKDIGGVILRHQSQVDEYT